MPNANLHPLDAAARRAFRARCEVLGGHEVYRDFFQLQERTAQRMFSMARDVPPTIARKIADAIDNGGNATPQDARHAADLRAWADHCQNRERANG